MASWTDGAAYAPIERPDGFATPEAEPLEVAVAQLAQTPGPIPPPQGFQPSAPQLPLEQIRTDPPPTRDPSTPFTTASATLTAGPDFSPGERDPMQPFHTYTTTVGSQELPPPTGEPLPAPTGAPLSLAELPHPGSYPPPGPGMPPPPGQFNTRAPASLNAETLKTLRTLLTLSIVALGIGMIVPPAAPWLVLATGLLGLRTKPLTGRMGISACCAGVALLLLGVMLSEPLAWLGFLTCLVFIGWCAYGLRPNARA